MNKISCWKDALHYQSVIFARKFSVDEAFGMKGCRSAVLNQRVVVNTYAHCAEKYDVNYAYSYWLIYKVIWLTLKFNL